MTVLVLVINNIIFRPEIIHHIYLGVQTNHWLSNKSGNKDLDYFQNKGGSVVQS